MEQISDGQQETAAIVIYEAFVQRMGGPWDGKDSSMAAQLCWASAGEIFRRIQLPPALTAARIEGERRGLERAAKWHERRSTEDFAQAESDTALSDEARERFKAEARDHVRNARWIRSIMAEEELPHDHD